MSAVTIGVLPIARTNWSSRSRVAASVDGVRTISTSSMRSTGLKKCSPAIRPARPVSSVMRLILSEEVFEVNTAVEGRCWSSWSKTSRFTDSISGTASTASPQSAKADHSVAKRILDRMEARSDGVNRCRLSCASSSPSTRDCAVSRALSSISLMMTENPRLAAKVPIPAPIAPPPMMATACNSLLTPSRVGDMRGVAWPAAPVRPPFARARGWQAARAGWAATS